MALFDPLRLELFAAEHGPSDEECRIGLTALKRLIARRLDGSLAVLTETKVEQSFNERIFAEAFGYDSVLRHGAGDFHILAKNYYPADGEARKGADDLALGFFGPLRVEPKILVSVELKDPGQPLDVAEGGKYGNRTPVQQAFDRVRGRGIPWVLVSNLYETRLYATDNDQNFEIIALTDIISVAQFRRAYALLSRRTLLGEGLSGPAGEPLPLPPLQKLFQGGHPIVLPQQPGKLRLIHVATVTGGANIPLHELEDGLLFGLSQMPRTGEYGIWPPHLGGSVAIELEGDRLVFELHVDKEVMGRTEFSKNGILRVTEYVDHGGEPEALDGPDLAVRIALFVLFAKCAFPTTDVAFEWRLMDLKGTRCRLPSSWVGDRTALLLASPSAETSATHAAPDLHYLNDAILLEAVTGAVRELLFPYRHVADRMRATHRARMSPDQVRAVAGPALEALAAIREATKEERESKAMEDDLAEVEES